MRSFVILAMFMLTAGASPAVEQLADFKWWIAGPLVKIKPSDTPPETPAVNATVRAARNEFEAFQIVLQADQADLRDVDLEFSDLTNRDGARIPRTSLTPYFEHYIEITRPTMLSGTTGSWPDALIPRIDRYANERRNAFPFTVKRGAAQPVWVELFVPDTARPGKYEGTANVLRAGQLVLTIPIHLTVWNFALPATSSLRTSFGLNGIGLLKQHLGKYTNDDDLYALTHVYARAALQHRISIHGGSMAPPKVEAGGGHPRIDWQVYDAEVSPFLNGTAIPEGEPLHGAKATSVELRTPVTFPRDEQRAWFLAESVRHFKEAGWYDRLFHYLWDEPALTDYPKVLDKGHASLRASAGVRNLLTNPFTTKLDDVIQIWTPLVNCLEKKPGFDDFCAEAPGLDVYAKEARRGKSLWIYQSCASHGCNIQGGPYFEGWPSYMIDAGGPANRVMQWVAWKYNAEGELYFNMDEAYGSLKDPWTDVRLFGGNGDGTLFYPGKPSRIGGTSDIPIESIRLKLIREGMEDYEYLALIGRLAGRNAADTFASRIVTKPWHSEDRPEAFLKVRQEMGEMLDRLAAPHPESGKNGR